jgi:glutaredoxin
MSYKLELYYFDQCPYCHVVFSKIEELKIKNIEYKDILKNPALADKLVKETGRRTVPCLYVNGKPLHESREIVRWLEEHHQEL